MAIKEFLASPAHVFNAINWLLIIGSMAALIFVPIPNMPGIKLLLCLEWLCFVFFYLCILSKPRWCKS